MKIRLPFSSLTSVFISVMSVAIGVAIFDVAPAFAMVSAKRPAGMSFEEYWKKSTRHFGPRGGARGLPHEESVLPAQLDVSSAPQWTPKASIEDAFRAVRDERLFQDPSRGSFLRRISWLYPDDGCFARAELASDWMKAHGFPTPAKLFAFGALTVRTANSRSGQVEWGWHVVPAYAVGSEIRILDPSMNPERTMTLQEWTNAMRDPRLKVAICDDAAYEPYSFSCHGARAQDPSITLDEQSRFLRYEWDRMVDLGFNPERVLGDEPPWSTPPLP